MDVLEKKSFWEFAVVPLLALVFMVVFLLLYRKIGLPGPDQIVNFAKGYYTEFGLWVVLFGALLEGTLFVGMYFPGSIVVVLGMILAAGNPTRAIETILVATVGFTVSATFNYYLGKYGWYKVALKLGLKEPLEKMEARIKKTGLKTVFFVYYSPVLSSFASTSAGIFRYPLVSFIIFSLVSFLFWLSVWGTIAYFTGYWVLKLLTGYMLVIFLIVWLFMVYKEYKKQEGEIIAPIP
ncbi:MAG TPA: VTT domain-containing protein [Patescibacteria group bacterium]|nr:VTT domain-containing protein [Patescibacteria group bacterium]